MNFRGKTIEEAIEKALESLGVREDELDIKVLNEPSKGIMGIGSKEATIDVSLKETSVADILEAADRATETLREPEVSAKPKEPLFQEKRTLREPSQDEAESSTEEILPKEKSRGDHDGRRPREDRPRRERREVPVLDEERQQRLDKATDFLKQLLTAMGYQAEYFIREEQGFSIINLRGKSAGKLIGKRGETLYALQYLVNIAANRNEDTSIKILLDIEDFRKERERTLTNLARKLAKDVKQTGESIALEPMNPLERKIIHMALQQDEEVETTSDGEETKRHIVISLKAQD